MPDTNAPTLWEQYTVLVVLAILAYYVSDGYLLEFIASVIYYTSGVFCALLLVATLVALFLALCVQYWDVFMSVCGYCLGSRSPQSHLSENVVDVVFNSVERIDLVANRLAYDARVSGERDTEIENLRTEVRDQRTEIGNLRTEVRDQRTEIGNLWTEVETLEDQSMKMQRICNNQMKAIEMAFERQRKAIETAFERQRKAIETETETQRKAIEATRNKVDPMKLQLDNEEICRKRMMERNVRHTLQMERMEKTVAEQATQIASLERALGEQAAHVACLVRLIDDLRGDTRGTQA